MVRSREPKNSSRGVVAEANLGPALQPTFDRLKELADLPPDWDSYGGLPPSPAAIAMARRVAEGVVGALARVGREDAVPGAVSPLADGGVQLAWHGAGRLVEIDIDPGGRLGYLHREGAGVDARYEEGDDVSWSEMIGLVRHVLGS